MTKLKQALIGTAAAAAMAVSATPATAKDRYNDDKIDAGEVIAGALIIGGIAAIANAASKKDRYRDYRDYRYNRGDRYYRGDRYRGDYNYDRAGYRNDYRRVGPRRAVNKCIRAVERRLGKRRADVTRIRDIDRTRYGYRVKGNVILQTRYDTDRGKFTCRTDGRGRPEIRFKGLNRGW